MIDIEAVPAGAGRFHAYAGSRLLATSHTPLLSAARVLTAEGVAGNTPICLRHRGSTTVALKSTVEAAARLTVKESGRGPIFVPYEPCQRARTVSFEPSGCLVAAGVFAA